MPHSLSLLMPRPKQVEQGADELLALAERRLESFRRPNIQIADEKKASIVAALEKEPSRHLVIALDKFVDWVGISPTFKDAKRAYLTAASLSRVLEPVGVKVGSRGHGNFLILMLVNR